MKIKKLVVDYEYDFDLYGFTTSVKDYKLAWSVNNDLNLKLSRAGDYVLETKDGQIEIINYHYVTDHTELRLFKNKAVLKDGQQQLFMVPELKHYEYFILVKGIIHTFVGSELLSQFRAIAAVQLVNLIDIDTLKSRDHFLY